MSDAWLNAEQQDAILRVAEAFGWDQLSADQIRLLAWSAFHYYVRRMEPS